jgi:bifunctional UDP-N-acetylglucosamine pyrophosphorylase/glucosamine-1-phosphate N-acetyltransferase
MISDSHLDGGNTVGPFARIRPGSHLKKGARVGNFVETKKAVIGEGSKVPHLTYIGDAKLGSHTNIGAGTITCNYDGVNKHPTTIGNRVFIGSNSVLVAPVRIGDGAYIGAGSTITENVPPNALGLGRGRQTTKPGWAAKKRREMSASGHGKKSHKPGKHSSSKKKSRPRRKR